MKLHRPLHNIQANIAAVYPESIIREGRSLGSCRHSQVGYTLFSREELCTICYGHVAEPKNLKIKFKDFHTRVNQQRVDTMHSILLAQ